MNKIYLYLDLEAITYISKYDPTDDTYSGSFEANDDIVGDILFSNLGTKYPVELTNFEVNKQWKLLLDQDSKDILGLTPGLILLLLTLLELQKENLHSKDIVLSADLSMSQYPEKLLKYYRDLGFQDEGEGIWSGSELLYQNMRASFSKVLNSLLYKLK